MANTKKISVATLNQTTRFINKNKQSKKQEKKELSESVKVYTVAESKDEKHWLAKAGNRTIAKVLSKQEAIEQFKQYLQNYYLLVGFFYQISHI